MSKRRANEQSSGAMAPNLLSSDAFRVPRNSLEQGTGGSKINDVRGDLQAEAQSGSHITHPEVMESSPTKTNSHNTTFTSTLDSRLNAVKDNGAGQDRQEQEDYKEVDAVDKGDGAGEKEHQNKKRRSHAEEGAGSGRYWMF